MVRPRCLINMTASASSSDLLPLDALQAGPVKVGFGSWYLPYTAYKVDVHKDSGNLPTHLELGQFNKTSIWSQSKLARVYYEQSLGYPLDPVEAVAELDINWCYTSCDILLRKFQPGINQASSPRTITVKGLLLSVLLEQWTGSLQLNWRKSGRFLSNSKVEGQAQRELSAQRSTLCFVILACST
jgi:hypothetical protein